MIPKKIHYVWVGPKAFGKLQMTCIESWKRVLPDYELKLWNEMGLPPHVMNHPYVKAMYEKGKWAFVSDYIRFWVLEKEGGIYLDTDTEVLRNFDDLLEHEAFFGKSKDGFVAAGVIGSTPGQKVIKDILKVYDEDTSFDTYRTSPRTVTEVLEKGSYPEVAVYDYQYFNPCDDGEKCTPEKLTLAYANNHWAESWVPFARLRKLLRRVGLMRFLRRSRSALASVWYRGVERTKTLIKKYAPRRVYFFLYRMYKYWQVRVLRYDTSLVLTDFDRPRFKEVEYNGVTFSILLDPDNGSLDKEIFLNGAWEKDALAIIQEHAREDGVFVDVGANIGSLTLFMAAIARKGKVHAFEPLGKLCDQLEKSVRQNAFGNIIVHRYGLSDSTFDQFVDVNLLNVGRTTLDQRGGVGRPEKVSIKRFDDIWDKGISVDFVKVDVEGHEYEVLRGMDDMLRRDHPILLFEYSPIFYDQNGTDSRDLLSFIFGLGYRIFDLNDGRREVTLTEIDEFLKRQSVQTDLVAYWNTHVGSKTF